MKFSLILSTYNRATQLFKCLQSLPLQEMRKFKVELIVADNASTDNTQEVIINFKKQSNYDFKSVIEFHKGSSNTRNAGLKAATGDVIIFTDDDCYIHKNYFINLKTILEKNDLQFLGGRIIRFDPLDSLYGCNHCNHAINLKSKSFIPTGLIQGSNMVITRKVYETIGSFDPNLGAGTHFRFDDIDYMARASLAGFHGAYAPEIVVFHHHGRKNGSFGLNHIIKQNDLARGSYYMKLIMLGNFSAILYWLSHWRKGFLVKSRYYEFLGFIKFLLYCIIKLKWPSIKISILKECQK